MGLFDFINTPDESKRLFGLNFAGQVLSITKRRVPCAQLSSLFGLFAAVATGLDKSQT